MMDLVTRLYDDLNGPESEWDCECNACSQAGDDSCDCCTADAFDKLRDFVNERLEEIMKKGESHGK